MKEWEVSKRRERERVREETVNCIEVKVMEG